ncbi:type I DNA topoisomerase [Candidatus Curculioniphilus buchneri]|uniref:type I DNA topoisomerase n=1 Tax=Candidatus Curculioniphilus buchneri TaxID=690594 RepID=UPI00376EC471
MGKALVIVESPAKAKTINKYLGNKYLVKSSIGHIRDLPINKSINQEYIKTSKIKKVKTNPKNILISRIGLDPFHGWKAQYEIIPNKEKIVRELKELAEKADHIYLATDLDREGEAMAWHLREVIGGDNKRFSRVIFNEITHHAIEHAFKHPCQLNIDKVNSQQTRRFMDRIVGYMLSPLLWKKIARGLSAGRVQSVAVRLIVERERAIKAFSPVEYWQLHADLTSTQQISSLVMQVTHQKDELFKPINQQQIQFAITKLEKANYIVSDCERKTISSSPNGPFTTVTLQQAASSYLGYSVQKTMLLAQQLYEAGYITYMRTDSINISQNAINMARNYIIDNFGKQYLPQYPNKYINKDNVQDSHEAIRPCDVNIFLEMQLNSVEVNAKKLYQLIWCQLISSQMTSAQYDCATFTVTANEFKLRMSDRILCFDGWTKVMMMLQKNNNVNNKILSTIKIGQSLRLKKLLPSKHFTKPPARYNEVSLIKELESRYIGRPSTYVPIISTIQNRGYVYIKSHRFYAEKIGEIVTDCLKENFCDLINYDFTSKMEITLDQIATRQKEWKSVLDTFFYTFSQQLKNAEKDPKDGGMKPNKMVITKISCLICGKKMGIRTASTGVFLGCLGYNTLKTKERCKNTINLIRIPEELNVFKDDYAETNALIFRHRCSKCHTAMDSYLIDMQHKLHICGHNPTCDGYEIEKGTFFVKDHDYLSVKCEQCGADMNLKLGRFGKYMACTNDACNNTRKILRNGKLAQPKDEPVPLPELLCKKTNSYFVLRNGAGGIFLASNVFPKSRETRAPLVEELVRFHDHLPEKFRYLTAAPIKDCEGNKTVVRFSRKTKQQYITSEKNGKSTGWTAFYIDEKWKVNKK